MHRRPGAEEATSWPLVAAVVAEDVVLPTVRGVHRAVTDAAFRWTGPLGRPVRPFVELATDVGYEGVRYVLRALGSTAHRLSGDRGRPMASGTPTPGALRARAIAVGVADDRFRDRARLHPAAMSLHLAGHPEPVAPEDLASLLPAPTARVVVLVHGLLDTEHLWRGSADVPSLPAVAAGSGAAVLLVRYDTGRPVAEGAAALARLLEEVHQAWPGRLRQLVLVGYSMGGLVLRDAAAQGAAAGMAWPASVSDVLHLATPHLGSWLEKAANVTTWTLRHASPVTAPLGALVDRRSQGIKDLRFGPVHRDPPPGGVDGLLAGWGASPAWQPAARHHLVAGRLRPAGRHPLNLALGDALVRAGSARGVGPLRRVPGDAPASITEVPAGHLSLVRRAEVATLLRDVLAA